MLMFGGRRVEVGGGNREEVRDHVRGFTWSAILGDYGRVLEMT